MGVFVQKGKRKMTAINNVQSEGAVFGKTWRCGAEILPGPLRPPGFPVSGPGLQAPPLLCGPHLGAAGGRDGASAQKQPGQAHARLGRGQEGALGGVSLRPQPLSGQEQCAGQSIAFRS